MKIWRFYEVPKDDGRLRSEDEYRHDYTLYAVTQVKKLAKKFREQRDMNLFIEKSSNVDVDSGEQFITAHRERLLLEDYFETVIEDRRGNREPVFVKVVHTENEAEYLKEVTDSNQILYMIGKYLPMDLFESELQQALVDIKYHEFVNFMVEGYGNSPDGFYNMNYQYDMFRTFMMLYVNKYKTEFLKSIEYKTEEEITEQDWLTSIKN